MKYSSHVVLAALLLPLTFAAAQTPPVRTPPSRTELFVRPPVAENAQRYATQPEFYYHTPPGREARSPQQWYQGDPADSLYRAAHALFSRQEYRQAAERYSALRTRFPQSRYYCDAAYYEAFSRQRLGSLNDLRTAYQVIEGMSSRCNTQQRRGSADVPELTARINGALARLGDAQAAERVRRAVAEGQNVCDSDERSVKSAALSALAQMDPQSAAPVLRTILNTKDSCSAPIRQQAVTLIARRNDPESLTLLGQVARNNTDRELQLTAVRTLVHSSSDQAFAIAEELLRTSNDERVQQEVAAAMARSEHARAQTAARALLERNDVAEKIRLSVIESLASRQNLTTDFWRTLYPKVESDDLRRAVLYALARTNTDDARAYLLTVARNQQEPYSARLAAISRITTTAPVNDLYRLMESADSRSMRMSIVNGIAARKEPEATDRLIDIAKTGTDPEVRNAAVRALSQGARKDDPRVIKALNDILGCCP